MQLEALLSEVLAQMLQEESSAEIKLEQKRVAEERRRLEEARSVQGQEITGSVLVWVSGSFMT